MPYREPLTGGRATVLRLLNGLVRVARKQVNLQVDANGNLNRYQRGVYDSIQTERMQYSINLGGTAESSLCPLRF